MKNENIEANVIEENIENEVVTTAYYYDQYQEQVIQHLGNIKEKQDTIIANSYCLVFCVCLFFVYSLLHNMLKKV